MPSELKNIKMSKTDKEENFPVGSKLIKKKYRSIIHLYYKFARTADDIADSKDLSKKEKIKLLENLDNNLINSKEKTKDIEFAQQLSKELKKHKIPKKHARDLLIAFRQDANETEYKLWSELVLYCRFSAAPVGRFLLDLHKEGLSTHWCSDRLCACLQLINHLQDIKKDYIQINRVYMPTEFMEKYGVKKQDFKLDKSTPQLRKLIDKMLEGTQGLLLDSKTLSKITKNVGLRMEICVITKLAEILIEKLKKQDPIASRVKLNKIDWIFATVFGVLKGLFTIRMTTEDETKKTHESRNKKTS